MTTVERQFLVSLEGKDGNLPPDPIVIWRPDPGEGFVAYLDRAIAHGSGLSRGGERALLALLWHLLEYEAAI